MSRWSKRLIAICSRWFSRLPAYCKTHVTSRVFCLLGKHEWSGDDSNVCQECGKVAKGLPRFVNPPPPPPAKIISSPSAAEEVGDFEKLEDCSPS